MNDIISAHKKKIMAEISLLEQKAAVYSTTDWLAFEATIVKIKALDAEMLDLMTEEAA